MTSEFSFLTPEFIRAHHKTTGIKVIPTIFPWRWLGCTDNEFMEAKMKFSHGPMIPDEHKRVLLGVIRQQETELKQRQDYVKQRETAMGPIPKQVQLELW